MQSRAGASEEENIMSWSRAHHAMAALAALALLALALSAPSSAQSYPAKPITIMVPLAAGTGMDAIARLYGDELTRALGKPVVIENRPGAALMLAASVVAAAPADGYTLLVTVSGNFATLPVLYKKINYNADKDFVPIALYVKSPFVLVVNPALPIHSVSDLIKTAKSNATPLTYSTPGAGTMQHLSIEAIKQRFGFDLTHVPYRSTPQSVTDIVAGHVSAGLVEAGASVPLIREGKLRALAVTSSTRLSALPDVPPFAEAANAPGFEAVSWHALVAPAATPKEIVDKLHGEMKRIMAAPEMVKHVTDLGLMPFDTPSVPAIQAYIKEQQEIWGAVVRKLGLEGSQ
jgi:tripartite-type tricarboxylate transporter receptor subunit TctC